MIPHLNVMQSGKGNSYGKDASQPHQASTRESNREGRATKRRSTATSMVAAAIEESITMAEEEERKRKEAERNGPHKSLKAILGIVDVKKKQEVKVPVVIDPVLSKMLRPHQIEGVKVSNHQPWPGRRRRSH